MMLGYQTDHAPIVPPEWKSGTVQPDLTDRAEFYSVVDPTDRDLEAKLITPPSVPTGHMEERHQRRSSKPSRDQYRSFQTMT